MKFNIIKCPIAVILVVSLCILIFGNTVQANIGWTEHTIDGDFNGASSVYATDVDGDGDTDVLGAAWLGHYITWWRNDGGSPITWTEYTIKSNFYNASSVYATDVDGDGDTDVLGAATNADDITWWESGPPPVAPPPPPPPPSPSPPSEVAVGVDIYPVDKIALLAPWIALSVAILAGFALVIAYRKARA